MQERIDRLQTKGIFCCGCVMAGSSLKVGILALNFRLVKPGQVYRLIDPDSGDTLWVRLPRQVDKNAFDRTLEIVDELVATAV